MFITKNTLDLILEAKDKTLDSQASIISLLKSQVEHLKEQIILLTDRKLDLPDGVNITKDTLNFGSLFEEEADVKAFQSGRKDKTNSEGQIQEA